MSVRASLSHCRLSRMSSVRGRARRASRSNYTMCAVNPSHVSKTFDDAALREVVDTISNVGGCLLEIVSFNVEVR